MIGYRPFLNSDPPYLAATWGAQPPARGLMQPMTAAALDQLVLAKPYFDRQGLIVATDEGRPFGWVHCGFGPDAARAGLDRQRGLICLLLVAPHPRRAETAEELLVRGEAYLQSRGARELSAGSLEGENPFYQGLYGGSRAPGILASDTLARQTLATHGYEPAEERVIYERRLAGLRLPVERRLIEYKRQLQLEAIADPLPADWWESCLYAHIDRLHYRLVPRGGDATCGTALLWDIEPMASTWGVHAAGLLQMSFQPAAEEAEPLSLATYLLGETLRTLQSQGITLAEVQAARNDELLTEVCQRLGFAAVAQGVSWRKRP